jgi:hypothetical protein
LATLLTACGEPPLFPGLIANLDHPYADAPGGFASGDLDGDGRPDLVVADCCGEPNARALQLMLAGPDATLVRRGPLELDRRTRGVAIVDVNLDGTLDLLVRVESGAGPGLAWREGRGGARFAAPIGIPGSDGAGAVAAGDFDADGRPDLAWVLPDAAAVVVALGEDRGRIAAPARFPVGTDPVELRVGDLDGDGRQDLAVRRRDAAELSLLFGRGDGRFEPDAPLPVTTAHRLSVRDVDGDGADDLTLLQDASQQTQYAFTVLLGGPRRRFVPGGVVFLEAGFGAPPGVHLGDVDGDSLVDLVVTDDDIRQILVFPGRGDGSFDAPIVSSAGGEKTAAALGDFAGDSALDLLVLNGTNAYVVPGDGRGHFRLHPVIEVGPAPLGVAVGRIDSDPWQDLAVADSGSNQVSILLGAGDGSFRQAGRLSVGDFPVGVILEDFDADGRPDLAVSNRDSNGLSVLLGRGDGSFAAATRVPTGLGPGFFCAADLDDERLLPARAGDARWTWTARLRRSRLRRGWDARPRGGEFRLGRRLDSTRPRRRRLRPRDAPRGRSRAARSDRRGPRRRRRPRPRRGRRRRRWTLPALGARRRPLRSRTAPAHPRLAHQPRGRRSRRRRPARPGDRRRPGSRLRLGAAGHRRPGLRSGGLLRHRKRAAAARRGRPGRRRATGSRGDPPRLRRRGRAAQPALAPRARPTAVVAARSPSLSGAPDRVGAQALVQPCRRAARSRSWSGLPSSGRSTPTRLNQ